MIIIMVILEQELERNLKFATKIVAYKNIEPSKLTAPVSEKKVEKPSCPPAGPLESINLPSGDKPCSRVSVLRDELVHNNNKKHEVVFFLFFNSTRRINKLT